MRFQHHGAHQEYSHSQRNLRTRYVNHHPYGPYGYWSVSLQVWGLQLIGARARRHDGDEPHTMLQRQRGKLRTPASHIYVLLLLPSVIGLRMPAVSWSPIVWWWSWRAERACAQWDPALPECRGVSAAKTDIPASRSWDHPRMLVKSPLLSVYRHASTPGSCWGVPCCVFRRYIYYRLFGAVSTDKGYSCEHVCHPRQACDRQVERYGAGEVVLQVPGCFWVWYLVFSHNTIPLTITSFSVPQVIFNFSVTLKSNVVSHWNKLKNLTNMSIPFFVLQPCNVRMTGGRMSVVLDYRSNHSILKFRFCFIPSIKTVRVSAMPL